jgi:transcriptional regulator with XRE-family HTH domain
MNKEDKGFREYVRRVMDAKGLTQKDVQHLSGGKITDSYVASILTGRAKNLSVEKIKALAQGLGVEAEDLFRVACGLSEKPEPSGRASTSDALLILEIVHKLLSSADMLEIMNEVALLSPEDRAVLLKTARTFNKAKERRSRGRKLL